MEKQHDVASKPKEVKLRAFKVENNKNLTKKTSTLKTNLLTRLQETVVNQRSMPLSSEDPKEERDQICFHQESPTSNAVFSTMLRVAAGNDFQHITESLFKRAAFRIDDIESEQIDTAAIYKEHYYFSLTDEFIVTNLPLNKTITRLQTYIRWFLNNDLIEFTPLIDIANSTTLSQIQSIVVSDPPPDSENDRPNESTGVMNNQSNILPATTEGKKIKLSNLALEILRKSVNGLESLDEIRLQEVISAELLIKINKKPKLMKAEDYQKILGAYLKPVSDLDSVTFKRNDGRPKLKSGDILRIKKVNIETTESGKLVEPQLIQEMSKFLMELTNEKNSS